MLWGELFPAMRRLELAGELLSGRFFEGAEGPQFLDPAAFAAFSALDAQVAETPRWVNSLDPAAAALYAVSERQALLPPRIASNRVCVLAGRVIAASTRSYRDLKIALSPDDPSLPEALSFFRAAREREAAPEGRIVVEKINGQGAARSAYANAMRGSGFEADRGRLVLW
jgi:ATP-dependent Lhr-like helicase